MYDCSKYEMVAEAKELYSKQRIHAPLHNPPIIACKWLKWAENNNHITKTLLGRASSISIFAAVDEGATDDRRRDDDEE